MNKFTFAFLLVVVLVLVPRVGAEVNPLLFGTWKLNLARSVYELGPPPKAQTQSYEPSDGGMRVAVETISGNGARIAYGYAVKLDGMEYPVEGERTPNGADTIAVRSIDQFTTEATLRRSGEVVLTIRSVLSRDGKVLTLTSKGTNANELPTNSITVFDRQ